MNIPEKRSLGSDLSKEDRVTCLLAFVHRFTREHVPAWAKVPNYSGKLAALQFDSDADWLAHTSFAVRKDGSLDERYGSCESSPTWPDNPELRQKST